MYITKRALLVFLLLAAATTAVFADVSLGVVGELRFDSGYVGGIVQVGDHLAFRPKTYVSFTGIDSNIGETPVGYFAFALDGLYTSQPMGKTRWYAGPYVSLALTFNMNSGDLTDVDVELGPLVGVQTLITPQFGFYIDSGIAFWSSPMDGGSSQSGSTKNFALKTLGLGAVFYL